MANNENPQPETPAEAGTPETPAVQVLLLYRYSKGKESYWTVVTEADIKSDKPLTMLSCADRVYRAKSGRGKMVGSVYRMDAKDAQATSIYPTTARWERQWPVVEDRAEWGARDKAATLEKQAMNADPVEEILQLLLQRYMYLPFGAKAVLLHRVTRAFTRLK